MKTKRRAPSGKLSIVHKRKKTVAARCAICKRPLHGVPRLIPSEMKKLSKTEKRPERIFGGYMCSNCTRERLKQDLRKKLG